MQHYGPRGRVGRWGFLWVVVVIAVPSIQDAWAQVPEPPPPQPPTFELPEVIVPGRRPQPVSTTPASVSVLTHEDLERLGVATIGEALQFVAEVGMRVQGGLGALSLPSIRGSGPNQVLVLVDGIPVNSVMQGLFDLSTLSTAEVDRVEILRGPFSAIYGGQALGGVINVITSTAPGVELGVRRGDLSTDGVSGRWSAVDGRVMIAGDRFSSAGFRPNSDVTSTTLIGKTMWEAAAGSEQTLTINHFQSALGVPGSTAFPSPQARQDEARTIVSTGWHRESTDGQWTALGYWWSDDLMFVDPGSSVDSRVATQVFGMNVQRTIALSSDGVQVYGAEAQSQALEDNGPVGTRQATVGGLYVLDERQLSQRTLLSAGLRYDLHSIYGGQLNPRLGIVHIIREGLQLRAGIGRTFRGPSFSELYFAPFNNPNLRPESAWSADLGVTWRTPGGLEVRSSLFAVAATDMIRPDASFVPQNIARATITGGSLELAGRLSSHLGGVINVTATRAVDESTGEQLLRVPFLTASAALHAQVAGGTLSALATYVGNRPDIDPASFVRVDMPGYLVTNLRFVLGAPEGGQWQIGVANVGDVQYEPIAGYPAPGRTVFIAFAERF